MVVDKKETIRKIGSKKGGSCPSKGPLLAVYITLQKLAKQLGAEALGLCCVLYIFYSFCLVPIFVPTVSQFLLFFSYFFFLVLSFFPRFIFLTFDWFPRSAGDWTTWMLMSLTMKKTGSSVWGFLLSVKDGLFQVVWPLRSGSAPVFQAVHPVSCFTQFYPRIS